MDAAAAGAGPGRPRAARRAARRRAARRGAGGRLQAGDRLPSTRSLASISRVSRTVTAAAYDQLLAEGWVAGRPARGRSWWRCRPRRSGPGPRHGPDTALRPCTAPSADARLGVGAKCRAGRPAHGDCIAERPRAGRPAADALVAALDRAAWRRAWRAAADEPPDVVPDPSACRRSATRSSSTCCGTAGCPPTPAPCWRRPAAPRRVAELAGTLPRRGAGGGRGAGLPARGRGAARPPGSTCFRSRWTATGWSSTRCRQVCRGRLLHAGAPVPARRAAVGGAAGRAGGAGAGRGVPGRRGRLRRRAALRRRPAPAARRARPGRRRAPGHGEQAAHADAGRGLAGRRRPAVRAAVLAQRDRAGVRPARAGSGCSRRSPRTATWAAPAPAAARAGRQRRRAVVGGGGRSRDAGVRRRGGCARRRPLADAAAEEAVDRGGRRAAGSRSTDWPRHHAGAPAVAGLVLGYAGPSPRGARPGAAGRHRRAVPAGVTGIRPTPCVPAPGQAGCRAANSTCGRSDGGCTGSRSSATTSRPASTSTPASFSGR